MTPRCRRRCGNGRLPLRIRQRRHPDEALDHHGVRSRRLRGQARHMTIADSKIVDNHGGGGVATPSTRTSRSGTPRSAATRPATTAAAAFGPATSHRSRSTARRSPATARSTEGASTATGTSPSTTARSRATTQRMAGASTRRRRRGQRQHHLGQPLDGGRCRLCGPDVIDRAATSSATPPIAAPERLPAPQDYRPEFVRAWPACDDEALRWATRRRGRSSCSGRRAPA